MGVLCSIMEVGSTEADDCPPADMAGDGVL